MLLSVATMGIGFAIRPAGRRRLWHARRLLRPQICFSIDAHRHGRGHHGDGSSPHVRAMGSLISHPADRYSACSGARCRRRSRRRGNIRGGKCSREQTRLLHRSADDLRAIRNDPFAHHDCLVASSGGRAGFQDLGMANSVPFFGRSLSFFRSFCACGFRKPRSIRR